jgi:hypothetical protein
LTPLTSHSAKTEKKSWCYRDSRRLSKNGEEWSTIAGKEENRAQLSRQYDLHTAHQNGDRQAMIE